MVAYHCDANAIMAVPFKSRTDKDYMFTYNTIMQRLKNRNMLSSFYPFVFHQQWFRNFSDSYCISPHETEDYLLMMCNNWTQI